MLGNVLSSANIKPNNFHKLHHFEYKNDVLIASNDRKSQYRLPSLKYESKNGLKAFKLGIPDWITFNNQILRFYAVSFDKRGSSPLVKPFFYHILYFLEDDTIQVIEKSRTDDLHLQGAHLKRHKISKKGFYADDADDYYRIDDFNINEDVIIYNKKYHIFDCDQFTREYLTQLGVQVPDHDEKLVNLQNVHLNRDTYMRRPVSCPNRRSSKKPLRQFLEYDGKVLTFRCLWLKNGRPNEKLLLLYYLADDTIEIREHVADTPLSYPQIGQPPPPRSKILVHRSKIPKNKKFSSVPGGNSDVEFYTDQDLFIGSKIEIWGRIIFIYDCDNYTKNFLNLKYGTEMKAISLEDIGLGPDEKNIQQRRAQSAVPTFKSKKLTYQPEFVKFIKYGPTANDGHILRFRARFVTKGNWSDDKRSFVISYHLVDDTITIYEKPERNTGYTGGVMVHGCKVGDQMATSGRPLNLSDFVVGATVCINSRLFQLTDADEYTFNYMEKHTDEFPASHHMSVLARLKTMTADTIKDLKSLFDKRDPDCVGYLDESAFKNILREMRNGNDKLTEQEIVTLKRIYGDRKSTEFKLRTKSVYLIQNDLRAQHFIEFDQLKTYFKSRDFEKSGYMIEEKILRYCLAYPLPVKKYVIEQTLKIINSTDEGIDYEHFVDTINWKSNPVPMHDFKAPSNALVTPTFVNYKRLIKDMEEHEVSNVRKPLSTE